MGQFEQADFSFMHGAEEIAARRLNIMLGHYLQGGITFPAICLRSFFTAFDSAAVLSTDQLQLGYNKAQVQLINITYVRGVVIVA
jgi:hypothetical protein